MMESIIESMIAAVRKQPCLWNPLHGEYREPARKDEAWKSVVKAINHKAISNVVSAKVEWRRLRDNHRDALKRAKLGKNKLLPAQITTWKYAKSMQFLEPYMKYRITENIEMDTQTKNTNSDQDVSTTEGAVSSSPVAKRSRNVEETSQTLETQRVPDSLEAFFNCVQQSAREMPPWMQTSVKKKIFGIIMEAEETLANQMNYSNHKNSPDCSPNNDVRVKIESEIDEEEVCIY